MAGKKGSGGQAGPSGGIKGLLATALFFVIAVGLALAFLRVNGIKDAAGALEYGRAWSDKIQSCGLEATLTGGCVFDPGSNSYVKSEDSSSNSGSSSGDGSQPSDGSAVGGGEADAPAVSQDEPKKESVRDVLNSLTVKDSDTKAQYSRKDWKHWVGSPCNTRETVLKEQGTDVVVDENCSVKSGKWVDPYSGKEMTDAKNIDIDHVVPLKWANANGGASWPAEKKQEFANDTSQLLAVSASENRGKGALGPSEYMPPNKEYTCEYSKKWVYTLAKYGLSIPKADKEALEEGLDSCEGE